MGLELPMSCRRALSSIDPRLKGVRWLREDEMHLTLSFLGEVDSAEQDALYAALREVRVGSFFLPLQGVGSFNAHDLPSVLWAGVGRGHPHLFALHKRVQDSVLHVGLEADLRPFHPHVTIARAKGVSREALRPFLKEYAEREFALFDVTGFTVFSSVLSPAGAVHTVEMRQPF